MKNNSYRYPDYSAEIDAIKKDGITDFLLNRIIKKHKYNAAHSVELMERYKASEDGVPIFSRQPRFGDSAEVINHRINNDFFSEIVDFKTGYFAGNPFAYAYANTEEALEDTGDAGDTESEEQAARDAASKALTDFVTRSNMFRVDMESTKQAAICGYAGRLFFIDPNGEPRVMNVPPNECIILSDTRDMTHPTYGVRYYKTTDINDKTVYKAEFYDESTIYYYEGGLNKLELTHQQPHLFDLCPLQGIPNNEEMQGDAEKVLALIDAYDRALSDTNNEVDSFANAYMIFKNLHMQDSEKRAAQVAGSIEFQSNGVDDSDVYFLTKDINDAFLEHHLDRLEKGIRHFSKTPNLSDESFGTASGVSLKFKILGLETKCGMSEAQNISAGNYMFELLAGVFAKRQIKFDPLQCTMSFKRNFPLDLVSEAQAAQAMKGAGVPDRVAYEMAFSSIDDIEYVMQLKEEERDNMPGLMETVPGDDDDQDKPGKKKGDANND